MSTLRERLSDSLRSFGRAFRNPSIRRVELAWGGSVMGHWAYGVALAVFAYQAGGAAAVGLVGLIRFLPPAFAAPFASMLADRYRRERVMVTADLTRSLVLGAVAVAAFADSPPAVVYVLAGVVAVAFSAIRPAQAALMPSLARTPEELTAANVASSTIESVGIFLGPALGGLLLAVTSPGVVFAVSAAAFLNSALLVSRVSPEVVESRPPRKGLARDAVAGFITIGAERNLRVLVALFAAQTLVAGALNVLIVVSALKLFELGEEGVGFLNSAVGVGGLLGALASIALVGRGRLASNFTLGILLWGLPIALIGVWPEPVPALVLLALVGVGNTLVDVSALTLLQRAVPDEVLARVFGALQGLAVGTIGLGSILAPLLIAGIGIRGALIATGALLPVLAALLWRRLSAIDAAAVAPERELALLRSVPIFAPLPAATLEGLAASLAPLRVSAGTEVFRQGDAGDRFYLVAGGEVEIVSDGRVVATQSDGGYFGEIALLRDVPRTATVKARSDVELLALDREEFIGAVTGHAESAEAADAVIANRLGSLRPGLASV